MSTPFPPDRAQLARFVDALFRYADKDTFVSLRAFDQCRRDIPPALINAVRVKDDLDEVVHEAARAVDWLSGQAPTVFAPPICTFTNPERARTTDLANGLSVSVEIDDGDTSEARRRLEFLLGPATIVVASGGEAADPDTGEIHPKIHLHWRLSEPTREPDEHAALRQVRDLAARLVGADPTGKPVVHPLRWPGSWNRKATPRLAQIIAEDADAEINLDQAHDALAEAVNAAGLEIVDLPRSGMPEAPLYLVASAMAAIPNPGTAVHYDDWMRYGYALHRATGGTDAGQEIWDSWSRKSDKFDEGEQRAAWKRICHAMEGADPPRRIGAGTIFFDAAKAGWVRPTPEPPPEIDDPGYWNAVALDAAPQGEQPSTDQGLPRILDPWNALRPVGFPIDVLPTGLREFVEQRAFVMGADPSAIAWACLSACSAAIHGQTRLQMKRHDAWMVPPALWVALVGAPSTKKTPIIETAWGPLNRVQNADMQVYLGALKRWKSLPKKEREQQPEPQMPRRLVSHDGTIEAMQDILANQSRGVGIVRDELAGWVGSMEKYAPGKGGAADRAFWLQTYNGGAHVVDRVQRGTIASDNLLAVVCGGIQPDRLRNFGDLTDDGLWQRFAPIIVAAGGVGQDVPPDASSDAYNTLIERLLHIDPGKRIKLSEPAHGVREDVQERMHRLEQAEVLGPRFTGFCGKLVGLWGRLCLVLHVVSDEHHHDEVSERTADAARALLFRSVLPNAARVYTAMGGAGGDLEATQSIAGYILTKHLPRVVVSDLGSNVRVCRNRSVEDIRKLLSPLEAGGWLAPEKEFNPTSWLVRADVHQFFADRARMEVARREMVRALITGKDHGP